MIGLGYVGLPLVLGFAKQGYRIIGVDVDEAKVDALRGGRSVIADIRDDELAQFVGHWPLRPHDLVRAAYATPTSCSSACQHRSRR